MSTSWPLHSSSYVGTELSPGALQIWAEAFAQLSLFSGGTESLQPLVLPLPQPNLQFGARHGASGAPADAGPFFPSPESSIQPFKIQEKEAIPKCG